MKPRLLACATLLFALSAFPTPAAGDPWEIPASPSGSPFWSYACFGQDIGQSGFTTTHDAVHGTRMFVASLSTGFEDYWYVLGHDADTGDYRQLHVQPPYRWDGPDSSILRIRGLQIANVMGGPEPELIVGLEQGRVHFHAASDYQELGSFAISPHIQAFRCADLNGDGTSEIVLLHGGGLNIYNASGQPLWDIPAAGGADLEVAQMDADPALEIAVSSGHVIDSATHAIQWTSTQPFGDTLRAGDIDGDGRAELVGIVASGTIIRAFDVDAQAMKWALPENLSGVSAIELANADADPELELICGDAQGDSIRVLDFGAGTPTESWSVPNPDSGVARIAVADTDDDGEIELVWAGGSYSGGRDRLNIVDAATRELEWQSFHLDGPVLGPVLGDVTGDGIPELVTASSRSESQYASGRILVFDATTLSLLGASDPVPENMSYYGLRDVKLRDMDGDGRLEIVISGDIFTCGVADVYRFTDQHTFERLWRNPFEIVPEKMHRPFSQVDAGRVDGRMKIVTGNRVESTINTGVFLKVFDYETQAEEWTSPNLGASWRGVLSMVVSDLDGDGVMEAVAVVDGFGAYVYDLSSHHLELFLGGSFRSVATDPGRAGFYLGSESGRVLHLEPSNGSYEVSQAWQASDQPVTGLAADEAGTLWVAAGSRVYRWKDGMGPLWSSIDLGSATRGPLGFLTTSQGAEIYTATEHAIHGFQLGDDTQFTTVELEASGALAEGTVSQGTLRFTRSHAGPAPIEVLFTLSGNAEPVDDYIVSGATRVTGNQWRTLIPANQSTATVVLTAVQEGYPEPTESLHAQLVVTTDYFLGLSTTGELSLIDDEPVISVTAGDASGSELHTKRTPDPANFTFQRTGSLAKPLTLRYTVEGSAIKGLDYKTIPAEIVIPAGAATKTLTVEPLADRSAEPTENVVVKLQLHETALVSTTESSATVTIEDAAPHIAFAGTTLVQKGMAISLTRSGGDMKAVPITIYLTYPEASGSVITRAQRVKFPARSSGTEYLFRRPSKAQGPIAVTVSLGDTASYFVDGPALLSFTLP
jgi:hypothetical protein